MTPSPGRGASCSARLRGRAHYSTHATDGLIGEVDDLSFDDEDWAIRYVVVDAGYRLGDRRVLISLLASATRTGFAGRCPYP